MSETLEQMAQRIRGFVTGRGHDWNIIAAARFCADSPLLMQKVKVFVDDDGWIEWQELADYVDQSGWSSGEKAAIRLACSLAGFLPPVDTSMVPWTLARMLAPLDSTLDRLAAEAVRYAALGPEGTR